MLYLYFIVSKTYPKARPYSLISFFLLAVPTDNFLEPLNNVASMSALVNHSLACFGCGGPVLLLPMT